MKSSYYYKKVAKEVIIVELELKEGEFGPEYINDDPYGIVTTEGLPLALRRIADKLEGKA